MKKLSTAIRMCDESNITLQIRSQIRSSIATLKNMNSMFGMMDDSKINKVKKSISETISLLESID